MYQEILFKFTDLSRFKEAMSINRDIQNLLDNWELQLSSYLVKSEFN